MGQVQLNEREKTELRCPYCHDRTDSEDLLRCTECLAPHHATCAVESDGCAACDATLDLEQVPADKMEATRQFMANSRWTHNW